MPAGRPPEVDSKGKAIEKCLVNATIPTKLRDFLRQHNINRSELLRTAALKLMELKICPYCYSHDITERDKGDQCVNCNKWLKFKRCALCEAAHAPESRVYALGAKVWCYKCPEIIKQK